MNVWERGYANWIIGKCARLLEGPFAGEYLTDWRGEPGYYMVLRPLDAVTLGYTIWFNPGPRPTSFPFGFRVGPD